jgi:hypothetical protein
VYSAMILGWPAHAAKVVALRRRASADASSKRIPAHHIKIAAAPQANPDLPMIEIDQ